MSKLVEGKKYQITVLEDGTGNETVENTYISEFRGFETVDLYEMPLYLLFWIEGQSKAWEFHYKDIVKFECL